MSVFSWLVLQVVDVVVQILELQPWVGKLVFVMLAARDSMAAQLDLYQARRATK